MNDVEHDLRKLGVKRWRTKALEREEWATIIKKSKAKLKEPYYYRKKKIYNLYMLYSDADRLAPTSGKKTFTTVTLIA
jgi:hypothetical protein